MICCLNNVDAVKDTLLKEFQDLTVFRIQPENRKKQT